MCHFVHTPKLPTADVGLLAELLRMDPVHLSTSVHANAAQHTRAAYSQICPHLVNLQLSRVGQGLVLIRELISATQQ